MATVEREIYFFRVDTGNDASGRPKPFNPEQVCTHINTLPWDHESPNRRYWEDNDKVIACWIDSEKMPCKMRLGNIRGKDLPQVEQLGELSPLEISEQAGLAEQTHIVFLTDEIIGCDKNFYGPRITRLPFYFTEKAFGIAPQELNISAIFKKDVYRQLKAYNHINLVNIRINAPYLDVLKNIDDSLSDALDGLLKVGESDDVEIILKMSRGSHGYLSNKIFDDIKRMIKEKDFLYDVRKLKIRGIMQMNNALLLLIC